MHAYNKIAFIASIDRHIGNKYFASAAYDNAKVIWTAINKVYDAFRYLIYVEILIYDVQQSDQFDFMGRA